MPALSAEQKARLRMAEAIAQGKPYTPRGATNKALYQKLLTENQAKKVNAHTTAAAANINEHTTAAVAPLTQFFGLQQDVTEANIDKRMALRRARISTLRLQIADLLKANRDDLEEKRRLKRAAPAAA